MSASKSSSGDAAAEVDTSWLELIVGLARSSNDGSACKFQVPVNKCKIGQFEHQTVNQNFCDPVSLQLGITTSSVPKIQIYLLKV